jgi:hypothetical protein
MSVIVFDENILACVDQTIATSAILDLRESDRVAIGVRVDSATGSSLLDLEESIDGVNYVVVASLTITAPSTTIWHIHPVFSRWKRVSYTPGAGVATFTVRATSRVENTPGRGVGLGATHV